MAWMKNFFGAVVQTIFSVWSWVLPFVLLGAGYAMPALRQTVSLSPAEPVYKALFWILIAAVIWVAVDYMTATNRETSVRALQSGSVGVVFQARRKRKMSDRGYILAN
jgi:hypothetical protein